MTMEVRLRPEAEHDLAESAAWYEQQRTGLGQEFLDAALATFSAITDIPNGFAVIHRSVRRALLHRFPFAVFYVFDRDGVVVLGVLHGSRHPRFWMNRV
jgi:plasmid stabilization system protein ParE